MKWKWKFKRPWRKWLETIFKIINQWYTAAILRCRPDGYDKNDFITPIWYRQASALLHIVMFFIFADEINGIFIIEAYFKILLIIMRKCARIIWQHADADMIIYIEIASKRSNIEVYRMHRLTDFGDARQYRLLDARDAIRLPIERIRATYCSLFYETAYLIAAAQSGYIRAIGEHTWFALLAREHDASGIRPIIIFIWQMLNLPETCWHDMEDRSAREILNITLITATRYYTLKFQYILNRRWQLCSITSLYRVFKINHRSSLEH